jgi:hypothetical protein
MAVRRDKIKQVMDPVVAAALEPGEPARAAALALKGPSPWWQSMVGVIVWFWLRYYYVVVTDRRVLFIRTTMAWGIRPRGLEFVDPLRPDAIVEYRPSALWSVLRYRRPDGSVLRLNIHRIWQRERDAVVAALRVSQPMPGATDAPAPPVPLPPPPA